MAEGTFEYECMRAELLGIDQPDYEEFMKNKKEKEALQAEEEQEQLAIDNLKEAEAQTEELTTTTGKLDELNSILAATQKKIDRFKFRCGSVTELIKTKIGHISGNGATPEATSEENTEKLDENEEALPTCAQKQSEMSRALDNTNDKLDKLLENTERAQSKMASQNKQMKKFLK